MQYSVLVYCCLHAYGVIFAVVIVAVKQDLVIVIPKNTKIRMKEQLAAVSLFSIFMETLNTISYFHY